LNERRLIEIAIAQIKKGEEVPKLLTITVDHFATVFPQQVGSAYKNLQRATENLQRQQITILNPEENKRGVFAWVDGCIYHDRTGTVELSFTCWVKPYLQDLRKNFTTYRLLDLQRLRSANAIRLYELLMQYKSTGVRYDTLNELKCLLGIEGKYKEWRDFKRRVLEPSVKNINESSNWQVRYKIKKKGRAIGGIVFSFVQEGSELS
jgi:plasmid replication initiation protein